MFELTSFWKMKVTCIAVVFGALGAATDRIETWINGIGSHCTVDLLEKLSIKGTNNPESGVHLKAKEHCTIPKASVCFLLFSF